MTGHFPGVPADDIRTVSNDLPQGGRDVIDHHHHHQGRPKL